MQTIYRSDDGKHFDSKQDCLNHEANFNITVSDIFPGAKFEYGSTGEVVTVLHIYTGDLYYLGGMGGNSYKTYSMHGLTKDGLVQHLRGCYKKTKKA